jgi:hypothetical protein
LCPQGYSEFVKRRIGMAFNFNLNLKFLRLPRLSINAVPKSEFHRQASFIDPFILGLCKFNIGIHPHSSNKTGYDDEKSIISGRPDYGIDVYEPPVHINKYTNCFGEVEPECASTQSGESMLKDFYKINLYGKLGLKNSRIQRILLFRTIGKASRITRYGVNFSVFYRYEKFFLHDALFFCEHIFYDADK